MVDWRKRGEEKKRTIEYTNITTAVAQKTDYAIVNARSYTVNTDIKKTYPIRKVLFKNVFNLFIISPTIFLEIWSLRYLDKCKLRFSRTIVKKKK